MTECAMVGEQALAAGTQQENVPPRIWQESKNEKQVP